MSHIRAITGHAAAPELVDLFKRQLEMCALKPGDLCLVVTDTAHNPAYAAACTGAATILGAETYQMLLRHAAHVHLAAFRGRWRGEAAHRRWRSADGAGTQDPHRLGCGHGHHYGQDRPAGGEAFRLCR